MTDEAPAPNNCLMCGKPVKSKRKKGVNRFFCKKKCVSDLSESLGVQIDEDTAKLLARGDSVELLVFFGLKALTKGSKAVLEALRRKAQEARTQEADQPKKTRFATKKSERDLILESWGLDVSSGWDEVQRRYFKLAKENHPDKGGDQAAMSKINGDYAKLKESFGV